MTDMRLKDAVCRQFYYKVQPTRSPTVNATWFITKIYLENYNCTAGHADGKALAACVEIERVHKQSVGNSNSAERTYQIILSPDWTESNDRQIQQLLVFYALCSFVVNKRKQPCYISVKIRSLQCCFLCTLCVGAI